MELTSDLDTDQQSANRTRPPGQYNRDEGERWTINQQNSNAASLEQRSRGGLEMTSGLNADVQSINKTLPLHHWDQDKETGIGMGQDKESIDLDTAQFGRMIQ
ncbi:hypothetical protein PROFUN_16924, partial [Planoprotostelium fungivorum]